MRPEPIRAAPEPIRAFSSSLPMALLRARESVMRCFRPALRGHGVTEQQWRVLRALAGRPGLEVKQLALETCLLAPSLSRILPDLESRGFLRRKAVASDMRRTLIMLTPAGARLIAAHTPQSEQVYRTIEKRFGSERLRLLYALLAELESALGTPPPAVGAPPAGRTERS